MVEFVDTHCHIQEAAAAAPTDDLVQSKWVQAGLTDPAVLITNAAEAGVTRLLCVGCTLRDSKLAVALAAEQENCWASIGIHPHEAKDHLSPRLLDEFAALADKPRVVAIGECGLDYYYSHSPKDQQIKLLKFQLELAQKHDLPVIFHVRDAFEDFWPIFDQYPGIRGVVHSFTADEKTLKQILDRGLYVGLNGIVTFAKNDNFLAAAKAVPLDSLLLETDAPFLTPTPFRGTICQPKHVVQTAEFLAVLRGEGLETIASATTQNARELFKL
jgi:TatD DNase family protein